MDGNHSRKRARVGSDTFGLNNDGKMLLPAAALGSVGSGLHHVGNVAVAARRSPTVQPPSNVSGPPALRVDTSGAVIGEDSSSMSPHRSAASGSGFDPAAPVPFTPSMQLPSAFARGMTTQEFVNAAVNFGQSPATARDALAENEKLRTLLNTIIQHISHTTLNDDTLTDRYISGPLSKYTHTATPQSKVRSDATNVSGSLHSGNVMSSTVSGTVVPAGYYTHQVPSSSIAGQSGSRMMPNSTGKKHRRHKRTETPEQRTIRAAMGGRPVFTWGIEAQGDRGLFSDFFDQIKALVDKYAIRADVLSPFQLKAAMMIPILREFIGEPTELRALLSDKKMRHALVAALVSLDIVWNTCSERFLINSSHAQAIACEELIDKLHQLGNGYSEAKHALLLEQKKLYTNIKNDSTHKHWRDDTTAQFSAALIAKLSILFNGDRVGDLTHNLQELYVKGYRIGFRTKSSVAAWEMHWPLTNQDFNANDMVNESKELCGSAFETYQKLVSCPMNYRVRFPISPTILKFDYSKGFEEREVVHSALVHVAQKHSFIGAERQLRKVTAQYQGGPDLRR